MPRANTVLNFLMECSGSDNFYLLTHWASFLYTSHSRNAYIKYQNGDDKKTHGTSSLRCYPKIELLVAWHLSPIALSSSPFWHLSSSPFSSSTCIELCTCLFVLSSMTCYRHDMIRHRYDLHYHWAMLYHVKCRAKGRA